ncbi:MAG TPA: phosphotransferase [Myxococcaceae bacterium]|jgi:trehalose synthase-fused probable maltokinase
MIETNTGELGLERLPELLARARWFGRKAFPIKAVRPLDVVRLPASDGREALLVAVEVSFVGVPAEHYLVELLTDGGDLSPAFDDDEAVQSLFRVLREGDTVITGGSRLRGERVPGAEAALAAVPLEGLTVRRPGVEQSNSSFILGEQVILKVIRRLEPGLSPEHELGLFLATRTGFRAMPALLGALTLEGQARSTIATAHEFVAGTKDGWRYLLERYQAAGAGPFPEDLISELRDLGRVVGELHLALAGDPDDPAFAPEPIQQEDLQRWSAGLVGEIGVTLAEASRLFPDLFDHRSEVVARAMRMARLSPSGMKIRIHGDLHLGQVLRRDAGWLLFDFEGEPARGLAQRREKHSPLRDVAGMLRSLAYATAMAEHEGAPRTDRLERSRAAFLDGYLSQVQDSGLLPSNDADLLGLLHALELEKVLYEIRYEVNNRPDWAPIPVSALLNPGEPSGA